MNHAILIPMAVAEKIDVEGELGECPEATGQLISMKNPHMIKNIIFDLGNVLISFVPLSSQKKTTPKPSGIPS
jgi:hypothetical protein